MNEEKDKIKEEVRIKYRKKIGNLWHIISPIIDLAIEKSFALKDREIRKAIDEVFYEFNAEEIHPIDLKTKLCEKIFGSAESGYAEEDTSADQLDTVIKSCSGHKGVGVSKFPSETELEIERVEKIK